MKVDDLAKALFDIATEFNKSTGIVLYKVEFELEDVTSMGKSYDIFTPVAVHMEYK